MLIAIECRLVKDDLRDMWDRGLRGKRNGAAYKLLSRTYEPGQLKFIGPKAALQDGFYVGVMEFEASPDDGAERFDFATIPGIEG